VKIKLVVVDLELSRRTRRAATAAAAALLAVGAGAVAYASVPHTWTDGETLTATDLNTNFAAIDTRVGGLEASQPLVFDNTGQLAAPKVYVQTVVAVLNGGASSENIDIDISAAGFTATPSVPPTWPREPPTICGPATRTPVRARRSLA